MTVHFVLRANLAQADQLVVNKSLSGKNNLLLVDFIEKMETATDWISIWSAHQKELQ